MQSHCASGKIGSSTCSTHGRSTRSLFLVLCRFPATDPLAARRVGRYDACLKTIEQQLLDCRGMAEYPIYVKALIKRQRGEINESLQLFQAATCLNPHNIANLKQVGRSLYLLARHKAALDVYEEALRIGVDDWEIWHNKGLCNMYLKQYGESADCLKRANSIQRHDTTFMQLGKVYTLQEDYRTAIDVYLEALEFSPENPELLTTVGLLYLRLGENYKAFDFLGNSLTHDPRNPKTILAAGSIIQDHSDMDVALVKSVQLPTMPVAPRATPVPLPCHSRATPVQLPWRLVTHGLSTSHLPRCHVAGIVSPPCKPQTRRSSGITSACASSASSASSRPSPA